MKKVLFYNRTFFGGGAEKVMIDYVRGLDKQVFDVTVMVRRDEGAFRERFYALEQEGVHIRQCCDWLEPGKNIFQRTFNYIMLTAADICEYRLPRIFHLIAIRDKYDVEIAFMHNEAAAIIASTPNRKAKKYLWVHTDLRRIDSWAMYFRSRKRQRRIFSKFDRILCVSQVAKQSVKELLGINEKMTVLHNPVDRTRIIQMSEEQCPLSKVTIPTVCAVGRLSWEKNFTMLLRVHRALLDRGVNHRLCIVGEGPERDKLEDLINSLHIEETAILMGHQDNPYTYVKNADFTAICSVYEGYPTVVLESLVLGKPVVSCCAAASEAFGGYECGIITDNDAAAFVAGLEKMLLDAKTLDYCTQQAIKRGSELGIEKAVRYVADMIGSDKNE